MRLKSIATAGIILLIVGVAAWFSSRSAAPLASAASPPVAVSAATVKRQDVVRWLAALGTVQSLNNVLLRPQIDGVLTKVLVREGDRVQRDQLLATIDDRSLNAAIDQTTAERSRGEASLKIARLNLKRDEALLAQQAISSQAVDEQRALVDQLVATVQSNQAAIEAAKIQRSYSRITSPVTGQVGMRRVDPGNLVHANDVTGLFSVVQVDPISVVFALPQQNLPTLQPLLKNPDRAVVEAYERDAGDKLAAGFLQTSDNQVDPATGTVQLRAVFPNANGRLWVGEFVTVHLRVGVDSDAIAIDSRALRHGLKGTYVFCVKNAVVEARQVDVSYVEGPLAVISAGLDVGDVVVTEGQDQLKTGTSVKVVGENT